jgi:hypothetical protein
LRWKKSLFLLTALAVSLPFILWWIEKPTKLEVVIINKTAHDQSFQEHSGITWLLNHLRYVKEENMKYQKDLDYYGFFSDSQNKTYTIRDLPPSMENIDVFYIGNLYGVYEDDLEFIEETTSPLIYGGLNEEEWQSILTRISSQKRSTLIMENNVFSTATADYVQEDVSEYLQLDLSGWSGKFFDELDPLINEDIPQSLLLLNEKVFKTAWNYRGAGFVLVNEQTEQLQVLLDEHYLGDGINVKFTEAGLEKFKLNNEYIYTDWFTIVTAKRPEDVIAEFSWNLTDLGIEELKRLNIPVEFAAIIGQNRSSSQNYFFAGNFSKNNKVPNFYQLKGLSKLKSVFNWNLSAEEKFFWQLYVPVLTTILGESLDEIDNTDSSQVSVATEGTLAYTSRIHDNSFEVFLNGSWSKLQIKGVNMGMGKPGAFPGEAAISEAEYFRWFQSIGEMGANTIRVYTLHPPSFYNALKDYNEQHDDPIYLLHGVWIDEEPLEESLDAFIPEITKEFQEEMKRIVDVIHGNALIERRPGHAYGFYQADVSSYVIGWILGIEWYPFMVKETNEKHVSIGDYDGKYVMTNGALPFEYWLAAQFDKIIDYEIEQYQWIRPMSFTNWVTTDLLNHPAEPNEEEDMVSVDPNVIKLKGPLMATNQFASYHVYPYYPDFLNYEEDYVNYIDHRGEFNNYAAYLKDLHAAHTIPVLIAEFGVPASRGLTHENPFGWNQGFLNEEEQGEIIVRLYEDIVHERLLGGLIFTWQDEWFKRTWNTKDYDNPERRPYWSNAQTNEQQFGLLSFDRHKIKVDGEINDWETVSPLFTKELGILRNLYMDHDERYLYFRLDISSTNEDFFTKGFPLILLDTVPNQGNSKSEMIEQVTFENGIDFIINLNGLNQSRVLVDTYYDLFSLQYRKDLQLSEDPPINNSGKFMPIHYALNREMTIPSQNKTYPFSYYETGKLRYGNGNPHSSNYDSLADFYIDQNQEVLEIRIPWLLLNYRDPSQRKVISDIYVEKEREEEEEGEKTDGIFVSALLVKPSDSEGLKVIDSFPSFKLYSWEEWDLPAYEERLKSSYEIVKKAFSK